MKPPVPASRSLRWLLLCALVVPLASCEFLTPGCTLVGCGGGLVVTVENAPAGPLTVQARSLTGTDSARTVSCPGTRGCTNTVDFGQFFPSHVQLVITTTAGMRAQVVRPSYTTSRPNGDRCDPTCRTATVTVRWE